ncbi:MAG TPA: outer membrane beta-barrel protein, partial [Bacteroidia bacterium]|nr:outer membrane beta-barrel protein [Bacteroidia bacterium]
MKKLFLIPALLFVLNSTAQTDKGWRSVGGTGHLTLDFKNKAQSFDLSPELYWFVGNNFALGTDFGFGFFNSTSGDSIKTKSSGTYGYVTPGFRYFFGNTDHKWRPYAFLNGGYEFQASHLKVGTYSSSSSASGFKGYAGMGLDWFFNEHAAFDIRLHVIDFGLDNSLTPVKTDAKFNPSFSIG